MAKSLRDRLAQTLAEHQFEDVIDRQDGESATVHYGCGCGVTTTPRPWPRTVAEMLASARDDSRAAVRAECRVHQAEKLAETVTQWLFAARRAWIRGDAQPAGVTRVYTARLPYEVLEWVLTQRGWYCTTEWKTPPDIDTAYCGWDRMLDLHGIVLAEPLDQPLGGEVRAEVNRGG